MTTVQRQIDEHAKYWESRAQQLRFFAAGHDGVVQSRLMEMAEGLEKLAAMIRAAHTDRRHATTD